MTGRLLDQRYVLNGTFAEQPAWGFSLRDQKTDSHRFAGNGGGLPAAPVQSKAITPGRTAATGLRAEIDALHDEMMAAFREQPASVAGYYTANARILGGGRRFNGTDEIRTYWSHVSAGATRQLDVVDVGGSAQEPWVLARSTLGRPDSSRPTSVVATWPRTTRAAKRARSWSDHTGAVLANAGEMPLSKQKVSRHSACSSPRAPRVADAAFWLAYAKAEGPYARSRHPHLMLLVRDSARLTSS